MRIALMLLMFLVEIVMIAGIWKTLQKAGKPGWGTLVPGYNLYLLIKIAGLSGIWVLYCLIPVVNIYFIVMVYIKMSRNFNMGAGYALGLLLLPFVFFPILGFGKFQYRVGSERAS